MKKKLILGHRGCLKMYPENTKLAFDAAFDKNLDGIELDVHKTEDGKLVIIHDEQINRTSDGKGYIKNISLKELQKFNFASKFNKTIAKQTILTYEEFLKEYGNKFKVINVEIKTDKIHYKNIEQDIWEIHKKLKPKAKIIYSSFNFETLKILRSISKDAIIGFLFAKKTQLKPILDEVMKICNYIHPHHKLLLNSAFLEYLKDVIKMPINTWTLEEKNMNFVKEIDLVEAIICNK